MTAYKAKVATTNSSRDRFKMFNEYHGNYTLDTDTEHSCSGQAGDGATPDVEGRHG